MTLRRAEHPHGLSPGEDDDDVTTRELLRDFRGALEEVRDGLRDIRNDMRLGLLIVVLGIAIGLAASLGLRVNVDSPLGSVSTEPFDKPKQYIYDDAH